MARRHHPAAIGGLFSLLFAAGTTPGSAVAGDTIEPIAVVGDAVPGALTRIAGDPVRGRRIALDREVGNCLICHKAPEPTERFQGDLGPDLASVGRRLTVPQLRLRLIDQSRINPATIMPPYYRTAGLNRVAERWRNKPVLTAQEIEDVVAYLATLQ